MTTATVNHEFYCWSPEPEDKTVVRDAWFVLDAADDGPYWPVGGPYSLDEAIRVSAQCNRELVPLLALVDALRVA